MRKGTIKGEQVQIPYGFTNVEYVLWCQEWDELRVKVLKKIQETGKRIYLKPAEKV